MTLSRRRVAPSWQGGALPQLSIAKHFTLGQEGASHPTLPLPPCSTRNLRTTNIRGLADEPVDREKPP